MNLDQCKLSKAEWDSIEVPVSPQEHAVLKMIQKGFHDPNISHNDTVSLLGFLKVKDSTAMHQHLFDSFIRPRVCKLIDTLREDLSDDFIAQLDKALKQTTLKKKVTINKADVLRLNNSAKTLETQRGTDVFDFVLIEEFGILLNYLAEEDYLASLTPLYTINALCSYDVYGFNPVLKQFLSSVSGMIKMKVKPRFIVSRASHIFEKNQKLLKYACQTLYPHQKKLFAVMRRPGKKLVLYTAPTGTGKTMSPIGLAEGKKVIFVCAARHVGLALAKAALSVGRKIAFAFGCQSAGDVKLHYAAATEFVKDWKTGGIRKVDNSVGNKVEMIISDVRSYTSAMHYMMAFTEDPNDIVMYWDEPTISLDYENHPLHDLIRSVWKENLIPNIVLSSATLPSEDDLEPMLNQLKGSSGFSVFSILSQDFKKTIPLLDENSCVSMPHFVANSSVELASAARHCLVHNSIMRYIDVGEAVRFILAATKTGSNWLTEEGQASNALKFETVFPDIESVTLQNIKRYYCELAANINPDMFDTIKESLLVKRVPKFSSVEKLTTEDAVTVTDGPAIYLTDDVREVADRLLEEANISQSQLKSIITSIRHNNDINEQVAALQKSIDDRLSLGDAKDKGQEKKCDIGHRQLDAATRQMLTSIENMQSMIKVVSLDDMYIPNKINHIKRFWPDYNNNSTSRPFQSDIPEGVVEEIMLIDNIDDSWKILLMMGIGVFTSGLNPAYAEIMKDLADTQQLFLIIASTDYIYGTNYQFCHGYMGKDLAGISQEKCIQALGRIGRNKLQYEYTIRFRTNELLKKMFFRDTEKPEARNMNRLLSTSD